MKERTKLQTFKAGNIDYYYPNNYPFNCQRATQMSELYSEISTNYGFTEPHKLIYIVGNNIDEANHFIGFDYTFMNTPFQCAAYTIREMNIIIASVDNHQHEIIHTIFIPEFPDANALFHEGIEKVLALFEQPMTNRLTSDDIEQTLTNNCRVGTQYVVRHTEYKK